MHWCSVGVQSVSKQVIYPVAEFKLWANAGIRVLKPLQICLGGRTKSKNCDEPINYTVRVSVSVFINLSW